MAAANEVPSGSSGVGNDARTSAVRQNWILTPIQDLLFVIAAPVIVLAAALALFAGFNASRVTSFLVVTQVTLALAHHLPTFIRIYGDVDLFKRFKWSFILGPMIPFGFALGVLTFLNLRGHPLTHFYYLLIILSLWDPWHFLMQHYGFMRIYDRSNRAPRRLAASMDLALCASWFICIALASGGWVSEILRRLYAGSHVPLIFALPVGALPWATRAATVVAVLVTVAYGAYVAWCQRRGYYISVAKIALVVVTFGVMALTYTPNRWILGWVPGWSFVAGYAVLNIVHVTQYLAIVWRYNRSLGMRPERARPGWFQSWFARGGIGAGLLYVAVCLAYGKVMTAGVGNRWLLSLVLAAGFTSNLMHYYFDGFIWKVRHRQNQENLAMLDESPAMAAPPGEPTPGQLVASWWDSLRRVSGPAVFGRQLLYFGLPMAALTAGAWAAWHSEPTEYAAHLNKAQGLIEAGRRGEGAQELRVALAAMDRQAPLVERVARVDPTASHCAEAAYLTYRRADYRGRMLPELEGRTTTEAERAERAKAMAEAAGWLEKAIAAGGRLGFPAREDYSVVDARADLSAMREAAAGNGRTSGEF